MASIEETIKIIFAAEDNASNILASINRNFESFDTSIQQVARPAAEFTKTLASVQLALAGVGVALSAVAIKNASEFQTSFNEISTLFTDTSAATGQFKKDIIDYASTSTQSLDSINKAVYNTISAGVDYRDSLEFISKAEQLSVAGKTDLDAAANILISTLNAYGKSTKEAADFSDTLFQAVRIGKTTLPELAASLSQVTGIASTAGISFQELLAAVAALTANGAPTSQAITGVRAAINSIIQPSSEATKLAKELGLSFDAGALKSKGLHGVLQDVQRVTQGNTTQFTTLFGAVEGFNAAAILAADRSGAFAKNLDEMGRRADVTKVAFDKMAGNFDLLSKNIQNNVKIIAIEVGTKLIEAFGDIPNLVSTAFQAFNKSNAFEPFLVALNNFALRTQDILSDVVNNLPAALDRLDFSSLINAFGKLGDEIGEAFGAVFGNIDLTTVDGLTNALQRGVDIIAGFVNVTAGIINQFEPIFVLIGKLGEEIANNQSALSEKVGELLGALTLIGEFGTAFGGALVIIKNSGVDIRATFDAIAGGARLFFNLLQTGFGTLAIGIAESLQAINAGLAKITFGETSKNFQEASEMWGSFSESFKTKLNEDIKDVNDSWGQLNDAFSRMDTSGAASASAGLDNLKTSAETSTKSVKELTAEIIQQQTSIDGLNAAGKNVGITFKEINGNLVPVWDNVTKAVDGTTKSLETQDATVENLAKAVEKYGDNFKVVNGKIVPLMEEAKKGVEKASDAVGGAQKKQEAWSKSVVDGVATYEQLGRRAPADINKVKDATEKATQKSDELQAKLAEISSKERIAIIDAKVKIDIASLEAQTKQVQATLEAINSTVKSTEEVLNTSITALKDVDGLYGLEKLDIITDQIEKENLRRDEALKMQKELTSAQVDLLRTRADAISKGNALIKVEGAGLQPHLEAIWFEILKAVQVRANQEGENFLLGLGV